MIIVCFRFLISCTPSLWILWRNTIAINLSVSESSFEEPYYVMKIIQHGHRGTREI